MGGVDWEAEAVLDCEDELSRAEMEAEGLDGCTVQPVPSVGQREGSKPGPFPGVLIIEHGVEVVELLLVDHQGEQLDNSIEKNKTCYLTSIDAETPISITINS